jgi:membrane fusion protein, multidrug efflux system
MLTGRTVAVAALCLLPLAGAAGADEEELDGLVEPYEVVDISSQVPGVLHEVVVERGDLVEQGQVLARLRDELERIAVDQARVRVEFSVRKAERNEELYESQLVSIHEKDGLETEIRISRLQLKDAVERLAMRTIRSPIHGVVTERFHAAGEYVGADPIVTIAGIDPLNVEVIAPLERLGSIAIGMRAQVSLREPVGGVYHGEVVIVDRVIDAASSTFRVRVELPNRQHALSAGLKCTVRFPNP